MDGYQTLKKIGVLDIFIDSHRAVNMAGPNVHNSSQNFYWHAYWLWELESAFRRLGGDYECFALPYWDVTVDGELWLRNEGGVGELRQEPEIDDLPIYNSNLGGDGDIDNDMCVGGLWSTDYYVTDKMCAEDEEADNCCLKRLHVTSNDSRLFSRADFTETIISTEYEDFGDVLTRITEMHGDIHRFIGSVPYTHFYANDGRSGLTPPLGDASAEPLFVLFHLFLDYVRLLRADCRDFDKVALDDLDQYIPYSFKNVLTDLDYEMVFKELCLEVDGEVNTFCTEHTVTPRLMYDTSTNGQWDVIYELGGFWNQNIELMAECADNLNDSWWANTMTEQTDGAVFGVDVLSINDVQTMHLSSLSLMVRTFVLFLAMLALYSFVKNLITAKAQSAYQCVV